MSPNSVFVCGVTGVQGGALARELLSKAIAVHAVARDPSSPKAKAIQDLGAKLWHGDFDNEDALRSAIQGTQAVFLNLVPVLADPGAELRQARLIIRLAKESGVSHLVLSSGIGFGIIGKLLADHPDPAMSTLIQGKNTIEEEVRNAGLSTFTIVRPGNFMTNYLNPVARGYTGGLTETGRWTAALLPDTVLPIVDRKTIGVFTSAAILDPDRFHQKEVIYADELLPINEILLKLGRVAGKELGLVVLTDEEIEEQKKKSILVYAQLAMRQLAELVSLDDVKSWNLPLSTFDAFLEREKDGVQATYADIP